MGVADWKQWTIIRSNNPANVAETSGRNSPGEGDDSNDK